MNDASNGTEDDDDRPLQLNVIERPRHEVIRHTKAEIMNDYEKVRNQLKEQNSEANKGSAGDLVLRFIDSLHELYDSIQSERNRDTKVHLTDSEVLKETAQFAVTNAKNIKFGDIGVAVGQKEFLSKLRSYMAGNEYPLNQEEELENEVASINDGYLTSESTFNKYNWLKLGALYYQVSRKAVGTDSLLGPLDTERKRPVHRTRTVDDTKSSAPTTAKHVQANDIDGLEEQNTANMVRKVYEIFLKKNSSPNGMNFFKFFINPHSFSQSVENLFFTSFLIKDARLKLYLSDEKIPMIQLVTPEEHEEAQMSSRVNSNHHIATFNYDTWKGLVDTFNITQAFLDHRQEIEDTIPLEEFNDF